MEDAIHEYRKRVKGYENIDGTFEMFFGLWWLSMALSPVPWGWVPVVLLGMWGQKVIKRRITYVRTGYLLHRRDPERTILAMGFSAMVAASLVVILNVARQHHAVNLARLGMCAAMVAMYAFVAMYAPDHKWKLLVVLSMTLGAVLIYLAGWSDRALELLFGLSWFLSGLATLYIYLQRTRPVVSE